MKSATAIKSPNGHGSVYKEVRFSPTPTPVRRTQSVPNAHPGLNTHGAAGVTYSSLSASYLDQARSLLDRQRISFENEKKLFNEERQLWEKERALLKSRISELEALLKGRGSTASATVPPGAFASNSFSAINAPYGRSHSVSFADQFHASAQVWEGSSPGSRPTRVFPDAETTDIHTLSSIPEQGAKYVSAPSLDAALSPKSHAVDPSTGASVPVPIEKLDSKLDGITLKSSALPPEVVARVITPPSPSPLETSPTSSTRPPNEHRNSLKLRLSELGPPEFNLTRNAGHTPMVKIDRDIDTEQPSPQEVQDEASPLAPAVLRQPAEQSDSYFADLPEDPALKGPLSLLNEEEHDSSFLKELDQRLLDQVKQVLGHHRRSSQEEREDDEDEAEPRSQGETEEPELRFKKTTNFGTAFGNSDCGKV
ncbi:uncharacterized protein BO66DRAFT_310773 [Aspergillus aculeatinus CBS 121060]|uniref:Uncharacterized protein n=2 Tax=Aspergillus subgen. Circumdati TaxID=2720871 RepID=A0ACD1HPH5_9EURO|nr:hypothetical protein BO95DRAFT_358784 [Aspergillus brunneoviolaceus CBS 621.78]XP_025509148.1 hypothetical protein BO66DRAFT_310773 [Aspergillus aculeatinus CBS 121060]RAH47650.1 hypothetical protein BO95DRAFT_358784 [Aspergillus brunneoviolaceus CBS 621.78]RAH75325.1 hypothetical protein BO66DRAFT_310773 [Aspergillus aculeatinus CBS 121060]